MEANEKKWFLRNFWCGNLFKALNVQRVAAIAKANSTLRVLALPGRGMQASRPVV
jgi:hypothetical protein